MMRAFNMQDVGNRYGSNVQYLLVSNGPENSYFGGIGCVNFGRREQKDGYFTDFTGPKSVIIQKFAISIGLEWFKNLENPRYNSQIFPRLAK